MSSAEFFPARNRGFTLLFVLIMVFSILTIVFTLLGNAEPIGLKFAVYLILALLSFIPIPILSYRLYALSRAVYTLDRDKLNITWGLRVEQIPISEIEWVRPLGALTGKIHMPLFHLPGSIIGFRRNPDLGTVEFMASEKNALLLIATANRIFAVSPENTHDFLLSIQRAIEMGTISLVSSRSVKPSYLMNQAWHNRLARFFWLMGLLLNIGFVIWIILLIPTLGNITLGFLPSGSPRDAVPGIGLLLLPVVSTLLVVAGWVTGLILFRRNESRPMAIIIWASGVLSTLILLSATLKCRR